ncbi:hypothetical protein CAPTEDRAFT_199285 [Capitella teleta]|uniref:CARD domain-containing protein n=1 Tax=Capitella teleta TaxID=283909 RepID=R7T4A5_CAPTE|nr:hypothetical protein CAPTEDRAFT_199285 [Capitella teleta]|eukprot:ELT87688.1 hypothetical protein CAPTEDRAFT_199285 [Capitella teleta]
MEVEISHDERLSRERDDVREEVSKFRHELGDCQVVSTRWGRSIYYTHAQTPSCAHEGIRHFEGRIIAKSYLRQSDGSTVDEGDTAASGVMRAMHHGVVIRKAEMNEMNEFSMSALHREILRKNRTTIIRDLIVDGVLLDFLVETKTLRDDMREHILRRDSTSQTKVADLLSLLPKRGPDAYHHFIESLFVSEQPHIAFGIDAQTAELYAKKYSLPRPALSEIFVATPQQQTVVGQDAVLIGTRKGTHIKCSPRKKQTIDLLVSQVLNGTTEEQMKKFIIQDENIQVTYILKTSNNADAESASFKIRVEGSDLSPLMKPEFWPEGVHCMRLDSNRNVPANVYPPFLTKLENVQLVTPTESKLHQSESGLEQG